MADDGLQIADDPAFQRRVWQSQRYGWLVLALILCVAVTGLTGNSGPFAWQTRTIGPVSMDAPRVTRVGAPALFQLTTTSAGPAARRTIDMHLDEAFLRTFEISGTSPAPSGQEARPDGSVMTIAAAGAGPLRAYLSVRARSAGLHRFAITLDGHRIAARTLVLP